MADPYDHAVDARPGVDRPAVETGHQQLLDRLAQQARLFDATLSAISDFAYSFDRDGRFTYVNKALLDLWGLKLEDALGKDFFDLKYPDALAAKLQRQIQQVFDTGRGLSDETPYTSPTGKGGYYEYIFAPVFAIDGSIEAVAGSTRDITARRNMEQALMQSQERLRTLFEHTQDAIMLADDNANYIEVNPAACEMTGYPCEELLRLKVWDVTPIPNRELGQRLWREFIAQGRQGGEYTLTRKDGSSVDVEYRAVANVQPGVHLSVLRDVTDRKRVEVELRHSHEALEAANKAKDQFLAVLSHELRTPLSPVVMTMAAMELHPQLPADLRDDVAMIRRNIDLETKLIDDLLDLSRVTSGKLKLQMQPTRLHELLRHAIDVCASDVQEKSIKIEQQFSAAGDGVIADSARLEQVFWNLLKNAVKFSHAGGRVVIRTSNITVADQQRVRIEVSDDGVGIPAEVLPRVFDAFEQGDARTTRQFGGLGLGLAISKAVIDMHGGAIRATSAGPGRGATFIVELDLAAGSSGARNAPEVPGQSDASAGARARILLVEDHADTARILARLLHHAGYATRAVHSVADALAAAAVEPFDLMLSDIGLPDGNGYDLMAEIHRRHGISGIALTGYGMEDDMRRAREAGFVDHVVKPVSLPHLEQVIRRALLPAVDPHPETRTSG